MISVVIPTLNEADQLPGCLAALLRQAAHQLIVADGGSTDGTAGLAAAAGAVLVECGQRQRAAQMNRGAQRAAGDVLLFLHADTRLPVGALAAVERAVADGAVGGCFRLRLEGAPRALATLEPLGDLHCRATRTTFGDRAIFARRDAFQTAGGYPPQEIMEDVELGRRLKRLGLLVVLPLTVTCSARHFHRQGGVRVAVKAALCCGLYDLGVSPERLARFYWGQGYRGGGAGAGGRDDCNADSKPGARGPHPEAGDRGTANAGGDSAHEGSTS